MGDSKINYMINRFVRGREPLIKADSHISCKYVIPAIASITVTWMERYGDITGAIELARYLARNDSCHETDEELLDEILKQLCCDQTTRDRIDRLKNEWLAYPLVNLGQAIVGNRLDHHPEHAEAMRLNGHKDLGEAIRHYVEVVMGQ